ncbi:cation transporter [Tamlana fucoidanivorans]|uniref:Copper chaperone n=1 Tax=Allotamlana fucoidanivorans TaxID=2583814 RepID=A0A5C4SRU1_9FLAO|nr:cation transporter [Tamlana fucoidanivorans]TNJ46965.1 copper chaperone [Tamlana fucoidanivorans]
MKKAMLSVAVIVAIGFTSCKNNTKKDVETSNTAVSTEVAMISLSFGVRGNCGMCKKTIEKAAHGVDGVERANWDKNKKIIEVSFDDTETNEMAIHNAIAASGYDTEKVAGSEDAYKNLPDCCQYDHDMLMNQSGDIKADDYTSQGH